MYSFFCTITPPSYRRPNVVPTTMSHPHKADADHIALTITLTSAAGDIPIVIVLIFGHLLVSLRANPLKHCVFQIHDTISKDA